MASTFYNKIEWMTSPHLVNYEEAIATMEKKVQAIIVGLAPECIWLLEHPALFTLGTSGHETDILDPTLPVYKTGRGGKATFHGPGQRIVYSMLDLQKHGHDLRHFIRCLEKWILLTLNEFGIQGFADPNRIGIWVETNGGEEKIASIGIRVSKWVTYHGFALNVDPDLSQFNKIIPCGLQGASMTSLAALGVPVCMKKVDAALKQTFAQAF